MRLSAQPGARAVRGLWHLCLSPHICQGRLFSWQSRELVAVLYHLQWMLMLILTVVQELKDGDSLLGREVLICRPGVAQYVCHGGSVQSGRARTLLSTGCGREGMPSLDTLHACH